MREGVYGPRPEGEIWDGADGGRRGCCGGGVLVVVA